MVDVVIAAEGLPKLQPGLRRAVEAYYTKLKRRQSTTNLGNARETAELLRSVVGSNVWSVTAELLRLVRVIGCYLVTADPLQFSVGNVVRRVLKIIREEYAATAASSATTEASSSAAAAAATAKHGGAEAAEKASDAAVTASLANLLVSPLLGAEPMNYQRAYDVKGPIIEAIKELLDELEVLYKNVSEQAINHIHADEVVMTLGQSDLVTAFLTEVHAKKRTFEVFVAEAAPECSGQQMAAELARGGIRATLISDAAIFALMARVDKVIIGTRAVMANGGLITRSGAHGLALAAKAHSVPLVALAGLHQLCPLYPHDQDTFNELGTPMQIMDMGAAVTHSADVLNPRFDYCPPELIDLSITNFGAHSPSYVYRMLAEYYNPEDHDLLTHPASPTLGGGAPVGGGKFAMGGLARLSSDH